MDHIGFTAFFFFFFCCCLFSRNESITAIEHTSIHTVRSLFPIANEFNFTFQWCWLRIWCSAYTWCRPSHGLSFRCFSNYSVQIVKRKKKKTLWEIIVFERLHFGASTNVISNVSACVCARCVWRWCVCVCMATERCSSFRFRSLQNVKIALFRFHRVNAAYASHISYSQFTYIHVVVFFFFFCFPRAIDLPAHKTHNDIRRHTAQTKYIENNKANRRSVVCFRFYFAEFFTCSNQKNIQKTINGNEANSWGGKIMHWLFVYESASSIRTKNKYLYIEKWISPCLPQFCLVFILCYGFSTHFSRYETQTISSMTHKFTSHLFSSICRVACIIRTRLFWMAPALRFVRFASSGIPPHWIA